MREETIFSEGCPNNEEIVNPPPPKATPPARVSASLANCTLAFFTFACTSPKGSAITLRWSRRCRRLLSIGSGIENSSSLTPSIARPSAAQLIGNLVFNYAASTMFISSIPGISIVPMSMGVLQSCKSCSSYPSNLLKNCASNLPDRKGLELNITDSLTDRNRSVPSLCIQPHTTQGAA